MSAEPNPDARVPDLLVEKLALGELPEADANEIRRKLAEESGDRLAAIERSNAEALREHSPADVAAAVQRRVERLDKEEQAERDNRQSWWVWLPVAAAAGLAIVWWSGRGDTDDSNRSTNVIAKADKPEVDSSAHTATPNDDGGPEVVYLKGDPQLIVERVQENRSVRMANGDSVSAGDRLQVSYLAAGMERGVIVSIDGAGQSTLHFPWTVDAPTQLRQGGKIPLDSSYELDEAPSFERFFFVTIADDETSLNVADVMRAADRLATQQDAENAELDLPSGMRQQSVLLAK